MLMTVAVVYKFVLVILGAAILLFWYRPLYSELGNFSLSIFRTFIKCNFSCGHSGNYVDAEYYAAMCAFLKSCLLK